MSKYKLAILTSHLIQYHAPLFQLLAGQPEIDLTVYFCWDFGIKESFEPEFGQKIKWDIPLLEGYYYKFLKNFSLHPGSARWHQEINPGIIKEIARQKYDAILIYGWNSFTKWLAFIAAFLTKTPVLLYGENSLNQELSKPKWKIWIKKLILGKILFPRVSAFLYIGEENKKLYQHYGVPENKLFFAPYAVDNERFMKAAEELKPERESLRKNLGISQEDAVILFVGKIIKLKRPFDLLKAYEILTSSGGQIAERTHLLFVGDGALRPELEKYAKEHNLKNIYFVGFKNQTELPKYYALADIFVLLSKSETWGLVINEAMCFGLPVIVSDMVGCGPDLVKERKNGFIYPVGDVKALVNCLKKVLVDRNTIQKIGKESLKIISKWSFGEDINAILKAIEYIKKNDS